MKYFILMMVAVAAVSAIPDQVVNLAAENPQLMANLFSVFGSEYHRHYSTPQEARLRLKLFRDFVKFAAALNAEYPEVEYGVTLFADMTDAEREAMTGFNATTLSGLQSDIQGEGQPVLGTVDHKDRYGPAKNQGQTNACWSFAATAVVEGHQARLTGQYTSLSEQMTADCTSGSTIARGGYHNKALEALSRMGKLAALADYPFTKRDGQCNRNARNALRIKLGQPRQARGDQGLANALRSGPVAVGMGFDRALSAYRGGIHYNRSCMRQPNHAVTAVGYTQQYWLVRNSYGAQWGERGYVRFTRYYRNMCLISGFAWSVTAQAGPTPGPQPGPEPDDDCHK